MRFLLLGPQILNWKRVGRERCGLIVDNNNNIIINKNSDFSGTGGRGKCGAACTVGIKFHLFKMNKSR